MVGTLALSSRVAPDVSVSIKLPRHHFQVVIYKGHETIDDSWPFIGKMKKEKEKKRNRKYWDVQSNINNLKETFVLEMCVILML